MEKKRFDPVAAADNIKLQAAADMQRWINLVQGACNDPFYPDGVNINLKRNHIIYAKKRLEEIRDEFGVMVLQSELDRIVIPPYIDNNYFAIPDSERAKKIRDCNGWKCHNASEPADIAEIFKYCQLYEQKEEV